MTGFALALVLSAALLHAGWNALLKAVQDRAVILACVSLMHVVVGSVMVVIFPLPNVASWVCIALSTALHYGYYTLLFWVYRYGDLSLVYPISRGMAPLSVAIGSALIINEVLPALAWAGVGMVSAGICLLTLQGGRRQAARLSLVCALALGLLIAAYSITDGIGIRRSDNPFSYMGWLFLLEFPVPLVIFLRRYRRRHAAQDAKITTGIIGLGLFGGLCAVSAYGIVLYVKSFAPLGAVSAVRESSVIFAALIGITIFNERPILLRLCAATAVAGGIMLLASA